MARTALIQKRSEIIATLVGSYFMGYADAAILADYTFDRGPKHIAGSQGRVLHYIPGRGWMIEGPA